VDDLPAFICKDKVREGITNRFSNAHKTTRTLLGVGWKARVITPIVDRIPKAEVEQSGNIRGAS
jgi:hypothetical protein